MNKRKMAKLVLAGSMITTIVSGEQFLFPGTSAMAATAPLPEIAHRGLANKAVEGTPQAMTDAIRAGYAGVEFDVRLTKDNRGVVLHDDTMDRTTNCSGKVSSVTMDEAEECGLVSMETMMNHLQAKSVKYKWSGRVFVHVKTSQTSGTAAGLVKRVSVLKDSTKRVTFMLEDERIAPQLTKAGWKGRQGLMVHTATDWSLVLDPKGPFTVAVTYDAGTPGYDALITTARANGLASLKRELWALPDEPQSRKELAGFKITGLFV